jgi:hypothetical protein
LVERLLYTQDVGGSSPSPPTSLRKLRAAKAAVPESHFDENARGTRLPWFNKPAKQQ